MTAGEDELLALLAAEHALSIPADRLLPSLLSFGDMRAKVRIVREAVEQLDIEFATGFQASPAQRDGVPGAT